MYMSQTIAILYNNDPVHHTGMYKAYIYALELTFFSFFFLPILCTVCVYCVCICLSVLVNIRERKTERRPRRKTSISIILVRKFCQYDHLSWYQGNLALECQHVFEKALREGMWKGERE